MFKVLGQYVLETSKMEIECVHERLGKFHYDNEHIASMKYNLSVSHSKLAVCSINKHRLTDGNSFSLWNALKDRQNIGLLQVTIHSADNLRDADIIKLLSQSDAYCLIELGNTRFRTRSGFKKNRNLDHEIKIQ